MHHPTACAAQRRIAPFLAAVILTNLSLGATTRARDARSDAADADMAVVLAEVDGIEVTRADLARWMLDVHGPGMLSEYLEQRRVARAAEHFAIQLDEDAVARALQAEWDYVVKVRFHGDASAYVAELAELGHTPESLRRARAPTLRHDLLLRRIAAERRDTSEPALRAAFTRRFGEPAQRVRVRVLAIERRALLRDRRRLPPGTDPKTFAELDAAALELARTLRERALAGEDFAELARTQGDGEHAAVGGLLEQYPRAEFGEELDAAVAAAGAGEYTPPVRTYQGFAVVRVEERAAVAFEDVKDELVAAIRATPAEATELEAALEACREAVVLKRR